MFQSCEVEPGWLGWGLRREDDPPGEDATPGARQGGGWRGQGQPHALVSRQDFQGGRRETSDTKEGWTLSGGYCHSPFSLEMKKNTPKEVLQTFALFF